MKGGRMIPLYFKVSPEEKQIITEKMARLGIRNQRAYLRKMAVDGYAVRVDMTDFKALVSLLRICSKATASFIKICDSAPLPIPTIKAVGVASPKAHGQAITKTDTAESIA